MQNIDPLFFLEPIIMIGFSVALVLFWHHRRGVTRSVLLFSLLAYAGAIVVKVVFQYATAPPFEASFPGNPLALGLYLGLQTVIFEVGGAFLAASYAVSKHKFSVKDAESYGLSLALWENAGLIGGVALLDFLAYYVILSLGGSAADSVYGILLKTQPQLFYPPLEALQVIAWAILERVSSMLVHLSWGCLCVMAASLHRKRYFLLALPMGLIDLLVPFAQTLEISVFEIIVFAFGVGCFVVTVYVSKSRA